MLCDLSLPQLKKKYITQYVFGFFRCHLGTSSHSLIFNQQKKVDSLYYTKIDIIICTFIEMDREFLLKTVLFQIKQHNSIFKHFLPLYAPM